jgi:hypothetical protein
MDAVTTDINPGNLLAHPQESTPVYIPPLTYIENKKIIKNQNEFSG